MAQIILYSLGKNCLYCVKAEEMFKEEIKSGEIQVLEAQNDGRFVGFPSFENKSNGKTHTGLPDSKEELYNKLEVSMENFQNESFLYLGVL